MAQSQRTPGHWVAYLFTFPWAALSYLLGALSIVLFIGHRARWEGVGILSLEFREWFARGRDDKGPWRYSTTIGRTIWWQPHHRDAGNTEAQELDERLERHEREHIWQIEDMMLLSFVIGLVVAIGHWIEGRTCEGFCWWFGLWTSGGLWQLPNFMTAALRFGWKNAYRDSSHERHAYAATDHWPNGESWYEAREARRAQD